MQYFFISPANFIILYFCLTIESPVCFSCADIRLKTRNNAECYKRNPKRICFQKKKHSTLITAFCIFVRANKKPRKAAVTPNCSGQFGDMSVYGDDVPGADNDVHHRKRHGASQPQTQQNIQDGTCFLFLSPYLFFDYDLERKNNAKADQRLGNN